MITLGVDLGSNTVKTLLLGDGREILSFAVRKSSHDARKVMDECLEETLAAAGVRFDEIAKIVATGYGRVSCRIAHKWVRGSGLDFGTWVTCMLY